MRAGTDQLRTVTRRIAVLFVGGLLLSGCMQKVWMKNYEPLTDRVFAQHSGTAVKVEEVEYATLQAQRDLPGYTTIGQSMFRDQVLGVPPAAKDSSLRQQAAECGATYVRWAVRPLTTVSQGFAYGGTAFAGSHEVFDYYAVFYRQEP